MDIKEAKVLARQASDDIEAILDELFNRTGISITTVGVCAVETTNYKSESMEFRHHVTLTASMNF